MIHMIDRNENDLFAPIVKVADINELQVKDFAKWLRKQARQYGRKAEIATVAKTAVEIWLAELGLGDVEFICGGEVHIGNEYLFSNWQGIGYYMFDEDGKMVLTIGEWLKIAETDLQEDYLIGR